MGDLKSLDSRSPSPSSSQQMAVPVAQAENLSVSLGFPSFLPSHLNHWQNLSPTFLLRYQSCHFSSPGNLLTPFLLCLCSPQSVYCYTAAEGPLTDKVRCHPGPKSRSPHLRQTSRRGALAWPGPAASATFFQLPAPLPRYTSLLTAIGQPF